jgi:hypothetical protein
VYRKKLKIDAFQDCDLFILNENEYIIHKDIVFCQINKNIISLVIKDNEVYNNKKGKLEYAGEFFMEDDEMDTHQ